MGADGKRDGFWQTGLGYLTQGAAALTAVGAIAAAATGLFGGHSDSPDTARLEAVDLTASGGDTLRCRSNVDPVTLDLTVRNTGNDPTVIKRLGLRIRQSELLQIPQAGGGLEPSKNYDLLLPGRARIGETLRYKVSQEVKGGATDRFTVRLDEEEPARQLGMRLYRFDVLLYHDAARTPVKTGTAVVALPGLPDRDFFVEGIPPGSRASYRGTEPLKTMQANDRKLRAILRLTGERPPELTENLVHTSLDCSKRQKPHAQLPQ